MRQLLFSYRSFLVVGLIGTACLAQAQTPKIESSVLLKRGDAAITERKWHDAVVAFQQTSEADPASADVHSNLSNVLALQLHPGLVTIPKNRPLLMRVLAERQRAIEVAPRNPKFPAQLAHTQEAIARSSQDPDEATRSRNLAVQNTLLALQLKPNLAASDAAAGRNAACRSVASALYDPMRSKLFAREGRRCFRSSAEPASRKRGRPQHEIGAWRHCCAPVLTKALQHVFVRWAGPAKRWADGGQPDSESAAGVPARRESGTRTGNRRIHNYH
jgi:hypothetical protein